jgi:hypothetical protein
VATVKTRNSMSAVRVTGSVTHALNNSQTYNDATETPTTVIDNLGEFSGHTFTAAQAGLYEVSFTVKYQQINGIFFGTPGFTFSGGSVRAAGSIPAQVPTGNALFIDVAMHSMVKLNAGAGVTFWSGTYGAPNGIQAQYAIEVKRLD